MNLLDGFMTEYKPAAPVDGAVSSWKQASKTDEKTILKERILTQFSSEPDFENVATKVKDALQDNRFFASGLLSDDETLSYLQSISSECCSDLDTL